MILPRYAESRPGLLPTIALLAALVAAPPATATANSAAPAAAAPTLPDSGRLSIEPYVIHVLDGSEKPAEIGRVKVPERHAEPNGRSIEVVFLRLRSTAVTPGPPVAFLPGGPGFPGTLLARTPAYLALFERLRSRSDVLVLDQRGSGLSRPTLQCATKASLPRDAFETEPKVALALGGMVRPCVRLIRSDGIAPEAYNTVEAAEDLEVLRRALGAERLQLVAVSYGTEVALEAIRRHGSRIDRAVLAGTRGPDMAVWLPRSGDLHLKRVSELIAADPGWARKMPDFELEARRVIATLDARPRDIEITDFKTGAKSRVRIGGIAVRAFLGSDLSDRTRVPLLPAIFSSLAQGDTLLFARRIEDLVNSTASGISVMQIATDCGSGGSPERRSRAGREARASALGNARNLLLNPAFCDLVGAPELPAAFREPIYSPTPVLFLTGALDGITPPYQAEEVRWGFPNGVHLLVENGWHESLAYTEAQTVASDFLSGQLVRGRRVAIPVTRFASIEEAKAFTAPRTPR